MAYTERYVTQAASGGGAGTSGDPWTLAEGFANAVAGDRVNIQSDGAYSLGATTQSNAGSSPQNIIFRGYNSTIGDLDTVGRETPANGSDLVTTNMPAITLTGQLGLAQWTTLMNLNVSGNPGNYLVQSIGTDHVHIYQCKFVHSGNDSSTYALALDNGCTLVMCDLECSGADHGDIVSMDAGGVVAMCRFQGSDTAVSHLTINGAAAVIGNLFIDGGYAVTIEAWGDLTVLANNTAYNCNKFFQMPNAAIGSGSVGQPVLFNNHVTDCTEFLDNLYSGTANTAILELFNRTRDNTTARTGIGDGLLVGEVTTDTGDHTTDYTDATSDDFSLINGAPGEDAALAMD